MKLPLLYKRTRTSAIQFWEIEVTSQLDGTAIITKTSGQFGTDKPLENIEHVQQGKNIGRSNETTPVQQAENQAKSDWKKKKDQGYKTLEDLGIEWDDRHDDWVLHSRQHYWRLDQVLEAALPTYMTDAQGNVKPMLAKSVNWKKVNYGCLVMPKYDGCVYGKTLITTDQGLLKIEDIVENRMEVNVLSFNEFSREIEFKPVINWFNNGESHYRDWLDITLPTGQRLKTTSNHKYLTNNGWKEAKDLDPKMDLLYANSFSEYRSSLLLGTILGDTIISVDKRMSASSYRLVFTHTNKDLFDFKVRVLNIDGACTEYTTGYGSKGYKFTSKALSKTDFPVEKFYFVGQDNRVGQRKHLSYKNLRMFMSKEALSLWIADDGCLRHNNGNKDTLILSISVHRHTEEQVSSFVEYFTKVWRCTPTRVLDKRVNTEHGSGCILIFNTKDTLYILNQLREYQCKGVEYKFYFPAENYIAEAKDEYVWKTFKVTHSKKSSPSSSSFTKYDIEVADNHNYVAGGIVIHNCRCLAVYDGESVTMLSRTGKIYNTLPHIAKELEEKLTEPIILDGEIYAHGLTFQEIVASVKKYRDESLTLQYMVYDVVSDHTQVVRWDTIKALFATNSWLYSHIVPGHLCINKEEVLSLHNHYVQEGYEGVMVRLLNGTYDQGQRSSNLLKVKEYDTNEYPFIEFKLGRRGVEDLIAVCKGIFIDGEWRNTVDPKMQGTLAEKQRLYENQPPKGTPLTVKHFGYTDDGLPRFPIGVAFRDYE